MNIAPKKLQFKPVDTSHKEIVLSWLDKEHVKAFYYGEGLQNTLHNIKWYVAEKKTFTLDLLIGETTFLGKGLAHIMIRQFILDQFYDAYFFVIDPEASNTKAIHVYEKAGFKKVGELSPAFNPKPHIMMRLEVASLKKLLKK